MAMYVFLENGKRRAIVGEIRKALQAVTGATSAHGFALMVDPGSAVANKDRLCGFAEMHYSQEWLLSLSAQNGMTWQTGPVPEDSVESVVFLLDIGFGNGSPLPQPTGAWQILVNGRSAIRIRGVNHSQLWQGEECSFAFAANRIESAPPYGSMCLSSIITDESTAAFGPALLKVPATWIERGQAATISVEPLCDVPSTRWLQIGPSAGIMQSTDIWTAVEVLTGKSRSKIGDYNVYFGDIHTHSGQLLDQCDNQGCGMGSRKENYEYAREAGALDFYSLTDHEWQIDPDKMDEYFGLADTYTEDGRFVCLPGFEYTNLLYGHRNVYFRESGGSVFNTHTDWGRPTLDPSMCNTPEDLWKAMEKTGVPFFTVPHHPSATSHPLNLDIFDSRYDRLYEIYSSWGSSEYYGDFPRGVSDRFCGGDFQDALQRGQRFGVIASSDAHDGHPGNAQSPYVKHHHVFHFCGSGRAVVLAPELTRAAVYDALHARRCYATTGPPIILDCRIEDAIMGSEIPASYYARVVQVDRESAWSSPIWVG